MNLRGCCTGYDFSQQDNAYAACSTIVRQKSVDKLQPTQEVESNSDK
jgi:hypothetical protein